MCKIKSQDSLKTDLLTLPCKCVYTHRRLVRIVNILIKLSIELLIKNLSQVNEYTLTVNSFY